MKKCLNLTLLLFMLSQANCSKLAKLVTPEVKEDTKKTAQSAIKHFQTHREDSLRESLEKSYLSHPEETMRYAVRMIENFFDLIKEKVEDDTAKVIRDAHLALSRFDQKKIRETLKAPKKQDYLKKNVVNNTAKLAAEINSEKGLDHVKKLAKTGDWHESIKSSNNSYDIKHAFQPLNNAFEVWAKNPEFAQVVLSDISKNDLEKLLRIIS